MTITHTHTAVFVIYEVVVCCVHSIQTLTSPDFYFLFKENLGSNASSTINCSTWTCERGSYISKDTIVIVLISFSISCIPLLFPEDPMIILSSYSQLLFCSCPFFFFVVSVLLYCTAITFRNRKRQVKPEIVPFDGFEAVNKIRRKTHLS